MSMTPQNCAEKAARRVPRGEKRREEIAAVAERVFLRGGFTETTMQIIAQDAGASKETLYRHFGNKEELFSEVIRGRSARIGRKGGEIICRGLASRDSPRSRTELAAVPRQSRFAVALPRDSRRSAARPGS